MRNISPSLNEKLKQQNQTHYNNANPHMSIVIARARSSVRDSSYFMIEKIREKEGITDIAVSARRLLPYGSPDRIYGIHIDNGIAKTSIREYPDKLKEHWKPQFDVAEAKGVSICFDGRWIQNKYKRYGFKTDETPWIFWIGADNKLYARIWDTGNIINLASDVLKVDAIRGYFSTAGDYTDDQGLIVAYVKNDGKVYYRSFSLQSDNTTYLWELEREVEALGSDNLNIRLSMTNDFRIGFIAEKENSSVLLLSKKYWAAMSIPAEHVNCKVDVKLDFIKIKILEYELIREHIKCSVDAEIEIGYVQSDNKFMNMYNSPVTRLNEKLEEYQDWGYEIYAEVLHNGLIDIDYRDFELRDSDNKQFNINGVEKIDGYNYKFICSNFNNASGDLTLSFLGSGNTKGYVGQDVEPFEFTFTPINLVMTEGLNPVVEVIWNE